MTGYQETLTDPTYHRQIVVMTAPHIGNTGVNDEDPESRRIWVAGYVVRDPARAPSNWRSRRSLDDDLPSRASSGISGIDTRRAHPAPARARRDAGGHLRSAERDAGAELLERVLGPRADGGRRPRRRGERPPSAVRRPGGRARSGFTVAALDLGIKAMTPQRMAERGIEVHVLPASTDARRLLAVGAGRRVLLERPGRPRGDRRAGGAAAGGARRKVPFFGICFGNQLLGRALGFGTYKLRSATAASTSR